MKLPPVVLFITPAPYCHHVVSYIFSNNKYSSLPFTLVSINAVTFFNVYVGFSWINVSFSLELRVFARKQKKMNKLWFSLLLQAFVLRFWIAFRIYIIIVFEFLPPNLFTKNKNGIKIFDGLIILLYNIMLFHLDEVIMGMLNNNGTNDMYIYKNRNSNWCKTWMCTHMCMYTCVPEVQYDFV